MGRDKWRWDRHADSHTPLLATPGTVASACGTLQASVLGQQQQDCTQAWHNGKAQRLPVVSGQLLGVDLDLASGCLTFYSLEPKTQPLHTFHAIFTQPLYPIFWLLEGRTLTLCHRPEATLPPGFQEEALGLS